MDEQTRRSADYADQYPKIKRHYNRKSSMDEVGVLQKDNYFNQTALTAQTALTQDQNA